MLGFFLAFYFIILKYRVHWLDMYIVYETITPIAQVFDCMHVSAEDLFKGQVKCKLSSQNDSYIVLNFLLTSHDGIYVIANTPCYT